MDDIADIARVPSTRPAIRGMSDVLALVHNDAEIGYAGDYALCLADICRAHLTVVTLPSNPARLRSHLLYHAPADVRELVQKSDIEQLSLYEDRVRQAASARGVSVEVQMAGSFENERLREVGYYARHFDVTVIALPGEDSFPQEEVMLESVLLGSGRGEVALPPSVRRAASFDRIMVAWDGGRASARALAEALPLLKRAAQVDVVTIPNRNGAAQAIPGFDIVAHLNRHGAPAEGKSLVYRTSIADTLLDHAAMTNADLVVMGAYGHSPLRESVIGGATRDMLRVATLPLLMAH